MADKLKAVLSKLSQKEKTKTEEKVDEVPVPEQTPEESVPEPETTETPEEPTDDQGEETVTSEPQEEISEEEMQNLKKIEEEISRLRDHGVFNAEVLFQLIKISENLDRIATFMEELGGKDAKK